MCVCVPVVCVHAHACVRVCKNHYYYFSLYILSLKKCNRNHKCIFVSDRVIPTDVTEEFTCTICYLLLVQPTTLTCGHTLCRDCLAKWYFTSHKKRCPLCNQAYQGHPMINTSIRYIFWCHFNIVSI